MDKYLYVFNQIHVDFLAYPAALFLLLIPVVYLVLIRATNGRPLRRIFIPSLRHETSTVDMQSSKRRLRILKQDFKIQLRSRRVWMTIIAYLFILCGFVCLTIAVAKPYGGSIQESRTEGIDIYFALDMSASMKAYDFSLEEMQARYAMDIKTPNRFDVARTTIRDFVRSRNNRCEDRSSVISRCDRVGIVMFAQKAFIDVPLTIAYGPFNEHLEQRKIDDIDASQSAIGDGILTAVASLRHSDSKSKNIILISDGDRKGGMISISQAITAAKEYGVRIFPIMIGSGNTAVLAEPNYDGYLTFHEAQFPVNFPLLEDIARETGGVAYKASTNEDFQKNLDDVLMQLEPHVSVDTQRENQIDLSKHFILLAFISLVFGFGVCLVFGRRYQ